MDALAAIGCQDDADIRLDLDPHPQDQPLVVHVQHAAGHEQERHQVDRQVGQQLAPEHIHRRHRQAHHEGLGLLLAFADDR